MERHHMEGFDTKQEMEEHYREEQNQCGCVCHVGGIKEEGEDVYGEHECCDNSNNPRNREKERNAIYDANPDKPFESKRDFQSYIHHLLGK